MRGGRLAIIFVVSSGGATGLAAAATVTHSRYAPPPNQTGPEFWGHGETKIYPSITFFLIFIDEKLWMVYI
jgi:hypothetical protein